MKLLGYKNEDDVLRMYSRVLKDITNDETDVDKRRTSINLLKKSEKKVSKVITNYMFLITFRKNDDDELDDNSMYTPLLSNGVHTLNDEHRYIKNRPYCHGTISFYLKFITLLGGTSNGFSFNREFILAFQFFYFFD